MGFSEQYLLTSLEFEISGKLSLLESVLALVSAGAHHANVDINGQMVPGRTDLQPTNHCSFILKLEAFRFITIQMTWMQI